MTEIGRVTGLIVFLAENQEGDSSVFGNSGRVLDREMVNTRNEEGVVGVNGPLGMTQLFYAENGRVVPVEDYKRTARKVARIAEQRIEMVRFTSRDHLEWIEPA